MNSTIKLTDDEVQRFQRLRPREGEAFKFWKDVCLSRGIALANTATTAVAIFTHGDAFRVAYSPLKIVKKKGHKNGDALG